MPQRKRTAQPPAAARPLEEGPPGCRRRLTIGFLTSNIHIGAGRSMWPGILDAAEQNDVNLICYPGGGLDAPAAFEAQRNAIYDLVAPGRLDGLVSWSSTVGGALTPEQIDTFHQRYRPLPVVSLAQPLGSGPTLMIDSYLGMRAAVVHLVEAHGYRRLAFMRGPESHFYAQQRYRAYTDVLQEYGILFAPQLVTPPLHWEAGAEAMRILLDERGLRPGIDFEAIVAVSDLLALEALKTLQGRDFRVPADVAIVGFNDSAEGRLTTPPLTSVALPLYEQGKRGVELLLAGLAGESVPEQSELHSQLVIRQSCGCPSQSVSLAAAGDVVPSALSFTNAYPRLRHELASEMAQVAGGSSQRVAPLLEAFRAELAGETAGAFLSALETIVRQVVADGSDVALWQRAISVLRRRTLPHFDQPARARAEDLWGQARVAIGRAAQRAQAYSQLRAELQAEALRELGEALITTFDLAKLADVLAERLPKIGIASCYLALYEKAESPRAWSRLVLAYTERGRAELEAGGRRFPSQQLIPQELLPGRRHSLVVEPLYFHEEPIGFAAFEIGPREGTVYEVLRAHISSALKGALLFRQAEEARLAAEKADRVKTRLLANVSHELRTPLNIIIGHTRDALEAPEPYGIAPPPALLKDLEQIQHSAEHQLRVINDLLDLSRAEIDELDLYPELLDARPLLEDAFQALARQGDVIWRLELPERLPLIQADPLRLRQVLLNLLSNARRFTERGQIVLGAEATPQGLHLWVADTGIGVPADQQEHIFEPFITGEHAGRRLGGIGLGLSITRRLVMLHGGSMALDSQPERGSTFHVYLPFPSLSDQPAVPAGPGIPVLLLISACAAPTTELAELGRRQGLAIRRLRPGEDLDALLAEVQPAALAWDLASAGLGDWAILQRLRNHPRLSQAPFILYGRGEADAAAPGLASFVVKPANSQALWQVIAAACPQETHGLVLIVDDHVQARNAGAEAVRKGLPDCRIRTAADGVEALAAMDEETPSLVILDLMMPGLDGFDVLDRMRADPRTRQVPVLVLSSRQLSFDDVRRLELHASVTLQSKGMLSEAEVIATLHRALFGCEALPPQTGALVKRALAYLHQNYARPITRWQIADTLGVSEDYLSRVFHRELGLSPWDYLNRYRVVQAKELLRRTHESIGSIAHQVGLSDQAYFSRVFRRVAGMSPAAYRERREP